MARNRLLAPMAIALALLFTAAGARAAPTFTVVTAGSGVQALRDSKPMDWWLSGVTFVDLDHDGDLDLYLADHQGTNGLAAINDGKGNFTPRPARTPPPRSTCASTSTKTARSTWT